MGTTPTTTTTVTSTAITEISTFSDTTDIEAVTENLSTEQLQSIDTFPPSTTTLPPDTTTFIESIPTTIPPVVEEFEEQTEPLENIEENLEVKQLEEEVKQSEEHTDESLTKQFEEQLQEEPVKEPLDEALDSLVDEQTEEQVGQLLEDQFGEQTEGQLGSQSEQLRVQQKKINIAIHTSVPLPGELVTVVQDTFQQSGVETDVRINEEPAPILENDDHLVIQVFVVVDQAGSVDGSVIYGSYPLEQLQGDQRREAEEILMTAKRLVVEGVGRAAQAAQPTGPAVTGPGPVTGNDFEYE